MLKRYSLLLRQEQFEWLKKQIKDGEAVSQLIRRIIDDKMIEANKQE